MFLSDGGGREFVAVGVGANLDEGPDAVAADGDLVVVAVEADGDRLAAGGAAVGEVGVADVPAGSHWPEVAEGACTGGARAGPVPWSHIQASASSSPPLPLPSTSAKP